MAGLDEYVFGYRRCRVDGSEVCRLANTMLKLNICSGISADGSFTLRERDRTRFISYAASRLRYSIGDLRGILGAFSRLEHRYGVIIGLITAVVLFVISSGLVWDVRVKGNERLSESEVTEALGECGLGIGSSWRRLDKGSVQTRLLSSNRDIAWISINRRGTVAYVEIIESENVSRPELNVPGYSNIVADRDGVIEEIAVKSGYAVVKVGDVVKRGDVLISGVIENDRGTRFCRAEGEVRARSVDEIKAEISRTLSERVELKPKLTCVRAVLFNFSINIFKNYGNQEDGCDIIEKTRDFVLFDRFRLPFWLELEYAAGYTVEERLLSDDEMTTLARLEINSEMNSVFKDADVLKITTNGRFDGDSFRMVSRVVYSCEIGKESAIEIS